MGLRMSLGQAGKEYCGKDRATQEAIPCNRFVQKDTENYIVELHADSETLLKRHQTVRDTTVASSYHRLQSDDDFIRAIEDLESRTIPMAITYQWVEGHRDKTKEVHTRIVMASATQCACRKIGNGSDQQETRTRRVPTLLPLVQTSV
jgi:hypothetical protein